MEDFLLKPGGISGVIEILLLSKWKADHNKVKKLRAGGIERTLSFSFSASNIGFGSQIVIY